MSEYTSCMSKWMKGPKELAPGVTAMCAGAKLCTHKAKSQDEAIQMCLNEPHKVAAVRVTRGAKCMDNIDSVVECLIAKVNWQGDLRDELSKAISLCVCGKKLKKEKEKTEKIKKVEDLDPETLEALSTLAGIWAPKEEIGVK